MKHERSEYYRKSMDSLHFSEEEKERMVHRLIGVMNQDMGGKTMMKKKKKYGIATAACLLLVCTTTFASSKVASLSGSTQFGASTTSYGSLERLEERAHLNAAVPKALSNGYTFTQAQISNVKAEDDEGNTVDQYKSLTVTYHKDGKEDITLMLSPARKEEVDATATKTVGGILLNYIEDTYFYAKDSADVTAEMKEREKKDSHYFISYGAKKSEEVLEKHVIFTRDGIGYDLMTENASFTQEELLDMAGALVLSK